MVLHNSTRASTKLTPSHVSGFARASYPLTSTRFDCAIPLRQITAPNRSGLQSVSSLDKRTVLHALYVPRPLFICKQRQLAAHLLPSDESKVAVIHFLGAVTLGTWQNQTIIVCRAMPSNLALIWARKPKKFS